MEIHERKISKLFLAKDYSNALAFKVGVGGIMTRWTHDTLGPVYEVRFVPLPEEK